ncbi:MAG: LamG-like jellyroll fold domain-containing protein [Fulvivirga sp.]
MSPFRILSIALFVIPFINSANCQDLDNGRVAFYSFTNNANDQVGSSHGNIFGATLTSDRFDNANSAYFFDGINDYISIPHDDKFNYGFDENFSISLWIKIPDNQTNISGSNNEILGKWDAFNDEGYPYTIRLWNHSASDDNLHKIFIVRYDSEFCSNAPRSQAPCPLIPNYWYHIAYVKNGDDLITYLNGTEVNRVFDDTSGSCNTQNTEPVYIGKRQANQRHFEGDIDDISFYNRAITEEEVSLLLSENNWTAPNIPGESDLLSFSFEEQTEPSVIDDIYKTISATTPCGTDLTNLIADFEASPNAKVEVNGIEQESGVSDNNFTHTVIYKVTSENLCNVTEWQVNVSVEELSQNEIDSKTAFSNFALTNQTSPAKINLDNHTIEVEVSCNTDLSAQIPIFSIPGNANAFINSEQQLSGTSTVDLNEEVKYLVVSNDGCAEQEWTIQVKIGNISEADVIGLTTFEKFEFEGQRQETEFSGDSIIIKTYCDINVEQVSPYFEVNENSKVMSSGTEQISGKSVVNLSHPKVYTVASQNGCYSKDWTVVILKSNVPQNELFIPNIITPNNDTHNEKWTIIGTSDVLSVTIFSRWGGVVYNNPDYNNSWNAPDVPTGTYFYTVNHPNCSSSYQGWLQVVK